MKKLIIALICLMCLIFTVSFTDINALDSDGRSDLNSYYNSDELLINKEYTINDYNALIGKKASYDWEYYSQNSQERINYLIRPESQDDYIIEIIPREYFTKEINTLEIGSEYGFYIKTTKKEDCYLAKVLLFDIEKDLNLKANNDRVKYSLKVLFTYDYVFLPINTTYELLDYYRISNFTSKEIIVPISYSFYVNSKEVTELEYLCTNDFYLKDISFAASLYNEQALNYGDNNYNAYNDYGSYFTGIDYEYNGKYWDEHEVNVEDAAWTFGSTLSFLIGISKIVPGPIKVMASIYDVVSLANDIIATTSDILGIYSAEIKESTKKVTGVFYHNNRDDQLANNVDSEGNHFLIKSVGLSINTNLDKSLWYGVNDYASVYYNIGHSAINDIKSEPTRINSEIALKVVDKTTNTVLATDAKTITDLIRTDEPDELTINSQSNLYFLPNGINTFTFTAPYAGKYHFSINSSNDVSTYINNKLCSNDFIYNLGQNELITINVIGGDTSGQGTIKVEVSNDMNNIQIALSNEYIVKLSNYNGVYQINTNNSNVVVSNILVLENGQFVEYGNYYEYPFNTSSIDYSIFRNEVYVILKNNANNYQDISLTISDVDTFITSNIYNKSIYNYPTYFKFIPSKTSNFIISFDNINGNNFKFSILNVNGSNLSFNQKSLFVYDVALNANQVYYVSFYTDAISNDASIAIEESDKSFAWEITDITSNSPVSTDANDPFKVKLQVGKEYELVFVINNHINIQNFLVNDSLYGYMLTKTGIEILDSSKVGEPGLEVRAKYNEDASYDYPLTIIPEIDYSKISLSLTNSNHISVRIASPRYVKEAKISINGNEEVRYFTNYKNSSGSISFNLTDNTYSYLFENHKQISVKLINVVIEDAKGDESLYYINKTISTDNYFAGGSGSVSDPFTISTYRHFYNIRNVSTASSYVNYSFKLLNDITITSSDHDWTYDNPTWEMVDLTFNGHFDGNNKTINYLKVYIDANPYSSNALFSKNYGSIEDLNIQVGTISFKNSTQNANLIYVGVLTGTNSGSIRDCNFTCKNSDSNYSSMIRYDNCYVGSFAGFNSGTIANCEATVNLSYWGNKGGICGYNSNTGVIRNCITNGEISFQSPNPDDNKQYATGGIVAINYGTVSSCKNYANISYVGVSSESRVLQPIMGQVIGINYGSQTNNKTYGAVNKGNLKTITWTTGTLWWQETHTFNQAEYVKNSAVGQDN